MLPRARMRARSRPASSRCFPVFPLFLPIITANDHWWIQYDPIATDLREYLRTISESRGAC